MSDDHDNCQDCPNKEKCSEHLPSQAFGLAYHGAKHLLNRVLEGSPEIQGMVTRAASSKEAREVVQAVFRGLTSAVVEAYQEEGFSPTCVMMDLTFALKKVYDEDEGDEDDEPERIEDILTLDLSGPATPDSTSN